MTALTVRGEVRRYQWTERIDGHDVQRTGTPWCLGWGSVAVIPDDRRPDEVAVLISTGKRRTGEALGTLTRSMQTQLLTACRRLHQNPWVVTGTWYPLRYHAANCACRGRLDRAPKRELGLAGDVVYGRVVLDQLAPCLTEED